MMPMCAKMKSKWASWISTPIFQIIPVEIPNILCFAPFSLHLCQYPYLRITVAHQANYSHYQSTNNLLAAAQVTAQHYAVSILLPQEYLSLFVIFAWFLHLIFCHFCSFVFGFSWKCGGGNVAKPPAYTTPTKIVTEKVYSQPIWKCTPQN